MAKVQSQYQGQKGVYYIVNPAGAVHSCDKEHARFRLQQVGWRLAEDGEIEQYKEQDVQRADQPIAAPWSPEPNVEEILPPAQDTGETLLMTEKARELAVKEGIDLQALKNSFRPTGADGRYLVKDVKAFIVNLAAGLLPKE